MNSLFEKFRNRGLSIVGVTDEGKGKTERWIKKHGVKYPYGYDKNGAMKRALKLTGYPTAWLVDPSGTIVWKGHPASLTDGIIREHLAGSLESPMWEWPSAFAPVAKALRHDKLAKALDAATKKAQEAPEGEKIVAAVRSMIDSRVSAVKKAFEAGDYLTAHELAKSSKKSLSGLAQANEIAEIAARISKDKEAGTILKAQMLVRKFAEETVRSGKDAQALLKKFRAISKKLPGTAAAREADEQIERLTSMLSRLSR